VRPLASALDAQLLSSLSKTGGRWIVEHQGLSRGAQRLFLVLWIGISIWLIVGMFRDRYPAAYLVEWQVQLFDGYYYPKLTIVLLLGAALIVTLPVGILFDLVRRKGPFRPRPPQG
jgi:hypothetical protein